jgi:Zinc-finger double-stranded RNA-binding
MIYNCLHCSRTFSTPYALKRHISSKHPYHVDEDEGESSQSRIQHEEEPGLWDDDDLPTEEGDLWDDEDQMVRLR